MRRNPQVKNSKIRISVPFSPELYKMIEDESTLLGISMSSTVAYIVGNYIASKNTLMQNLNVVLKEQLENALDKK